MNHLYILHLGASILGAYTSPSQLTEAQTGWNNDFVRRFGRSPTQGESPKVAHMQVNRRPKGPVLVGEDQIVFGGEAN